MRRFPIACLLCLMVGWACNPARAETRMGVIATKTENAQNLASLLELRLAQRPATALVERNEIDKVLGEQELQALLVADAPGKRAALGKMLKADLLIFLAERQKPKPHLLVVVCETARGLRLCAEPVFLSKQAEADVAALLGKVEDAAKKQQAKITDIVAVPPLLNNSLTQEADNLQGGFACFVEQTLLRRPGLLVVELAEAKALAREIALSGTPGIERRLPLYLMGEYRVDGSGESRRGQYAWRLLRGEKELGRREEKGLPWPKFARGLQRAATELIDKAAGTEVQPSDPLAEAKHLAEREHAFVAIGQWQQGLALAEASLMLNPDQPAVHGDALHAIMDMNGDWQSRWSVTAKTIPWLRAALPHLEGYFRGTKVLFVDYAYVRTNRWGIDIDIGGERRLPPELRQDYYALLCEMAATADRILVAKAEAKVMDESLEFLGHWDEKYGLFDEGTGTPAWRSTWLSKELPAICEHRLKLLQAFSWMGGQRDYEYCEHKFHGYYPFYYGLATLPGLRDFLADTPCIELTDLTQTELYPLYVDFFAKLKKMPDPHLQELADRFTDRFHRLAELRKEGEKRTAQRFKQAQDSIAESLQPLVVKPPVKDPEAVCHRLTLRRTTADGGDEIIQRPGDRPRHLLGTWAPLYEGCDLVCLECGEIALMKEKGRLRVLPIRIGLVDDYSNTCANVCWDGQYLWALSPGEAGPLVVIEPRREKVWQAGPKGTPPPSHCCAIAPLGPGKVCIAGYFGRLWVAMASFDPAKGIELEVIHEARDVVDLFHMGIGEKPANTSPKLAMEVQFAATVTAPAVDGHPAQRRVFIGRRANSPLLVDPETKKVTAADFYMSECFRLEDENTIYWTKNTGRWGPDGFFGPLYRIGLPGFTQEVLSPDCPFGKRTLFQGKFYLTAAHPTEDRGKDRLYVASATEGPFHALRCNIPGVASHLLLSNHYGLLVVTNSGVYQVELARPGVALKPDADEAARDAAEARRWVVIVNPAFFDSKALKTALDDVMRRSFEGDFAGALARLNRLVVALPLASAVPHYRGALLDALGEERLALADYREVLKIGKGPPPTNADQAALAIWIIGSRRGSRAEADRELRRYFEGRTPDMQANWYVYFVNFLLDRHADENALEAKVQAVEPPSERLTYTAGLYYFFSIRRQLAGDKAGALKMLEKCAATNSRNEIQWFESTLRLGIASGKIPSPQKPEAGNWRAELPAPPAGDEAEGEQPAAAGKDEEKPKDDGEAAARKKKAADARAAKFRPWSDASGSFHRTAKFRGLANKVVKLELENGSVISVPLEKLSDEDQKYIRRRTR